MWERFSRFRRPRNVTTIRENAVQWLIDHPGQFTVNRLAVDLGLERRQALNALHGLKRTGLGAQLQHRGSGVWCYTPTQVIREQSGDFHEDGLTTRVPVGWTRRIGVVARAGAEYFVQVLDEKSKPNGLLLKVSPVIGGYELIDPIPT